jgi:ABC-2 type transport system permease protein
MWTGILGLVVKEFLTLFKDTRSRLVIIMPPVIQLLVFGYAATFDLTRLPYAVYNEDRGAASQDLLAGFRGSPSFRQVAQITHDGQVPALIDREEALLVLHIGPRFSSDLLLGKTGSVQVIVDGRDSNTAMLALNYVREIINRFNDNWTGRQGLRSLPARLEVRAWFNPNLESRRFFVPGVACLLTLVVTMLVTALSVAREREQGTFDQLLVTPLRPIDMLIGKALPGFIIGAAEASLVIAIAIAWSPCTRASCCSCSRRSAWG